MPALRATPRRQSEASCKMSRFSRGSPRLRQRGRLHHPPRAAAEFFGRRGIARGRQVNRQSNRAAAFFSALFILIAAGLLVAPASRAQQPPTPETTPPPAAAPIANGQVQGYTLTPGQEAQ